MTLEEACEAMLDELREEYDLGPGDAKDLFEAIWHQMIKDAKGVALNKAIDTVAKELNIWEIGK